MHSCLFFALVFIKPDEFKKQPPVDEKNNISKKSITNVSHTHHTHYNFHDNGDEGKYINRYSLI